MPAPIPEVHGHTIPTSWSAVETPPRAGSMAFSPASRILASPERSAGLYMSPQVSQAPTSRTSSDRKQSLHVEFPGFVLHWDPEYVPSTGISGGSIVPDGERGRTKSVENRDIDGIAYFCLTEQSERLWLENECCSQFIAFMNSHTKACLEWSSRDSRGAIARAIILQEQENRMAALRTHNHEREVLMTRTFRESFIEYFAERDIMLCTQERERYRIQLSKLADHSHIALLWECLAGRQLIVEEETQACAVLQTMAGKMSESSSVQRFASQLGLLVREYTMLRQTIVNDWRSELYDMARWMRVCGSPYYNDHYTPPIRSPANSSVRSPISCLTPKMCRSPLSGFTPNSKIPLPSPTLCSPVFDNVEYTHVCPPTHEEFIAVNIEIQNCTDTLAALECQCIVRAHAYSLQELRSTELGCRGAIYKLHARTIDVYRHDIRAALWGKCVAGASMIAEEEAIERLRATQLFRVIEQYCRERCNIALSELRARQCIPSLSAFSITASQIDLGDRAVMNVYVRQLRQAQASETAKRRTLCTHECQCFIMMCSRMFSSLFTFMQRDALSKHKEFLVEYRMKLSTATEYCRKWRVRESLDSTFAFASPMTYPRQELPKDTATRQLDTSLKCICLSFSSKLNEIATTKLGYSESTSRRELVEIESLNRERLLQASCREMAAVLQRLLVESSAKNASRSLFLEEELQRQTIMQSELSELFHSSAFFRIICKNISDNETRRRNIFTSATVASRSGRGV